MWDGSGANWSRHERRRGRPPKETRVVLGADVGVAPPGDRGAADEVRAPTPDDSFASPSFANSHGWQHANPFAPDSGYQFADTSRGVRIPPKRQRSESFLGPDDDVQPTRAFGASPKRALSELMANNLQKLNVSRLQCRSPRTTAAGSDSPGRARAARGCPTVRRHRRRPHRLGERPRRRWTRARRR